MFIINVQVGKAYKPNYGAAPVIRGTAYGITRLSAEASLREFGGQYT